MNESLDWARQEETFRRSQLVREIQRLESEERGAQAKLADIQSRLANMRHELADLSSEYRPNIQ